MTSKEFQICSLWPKLKFNVDTFCSSDQSAEIKIAPSLDRSSKIRSIVSVCSAAIRWQHWHITLNHNMKLLLDSRLATLLQSHRLLDKNSIITHKKTAFLRP